MPSLRTFIAAGLGLLAAAPLSAQVEAETEGGQIQAPAEEQAKPSVELPAPICQVDAVESNAADAPKQLRAVCGTHGLFLGPVTDFSVIPNGTLRAMLVDVVYHTKRRVLMLSLGDDGVPALEDITGQIARTAGKSAMSGIDDVKVDLADFATAGSIAVSSKAAGQPETETAQIGLGEQIAAEQATAGQASASGAVQQ